MPQEYIERRDVGYYFVASRVSLDSAVYQFLAGESPEGWRKRKGIAMVRMANGSIRQAEVHWYEAHGVGRKGWKIKRFLDSQS